MSTLPPHTHTHTHNDALSCLCETACLSAPPIFPSSSHHPLPPLQMVSFPNTLITHHPDEWSYIIPSVANNPIGKRLSRQPRERERQRERERERHRVRDGKARLWWGGWIRFIWSLVSVLIFSAQLKGCVHTHKNAHTHTHTQVWTRPSPYGGVIRSIAQLPCCLVVAVLSP